MPGLRILWPMDAEELLRSIYDAFNARDIDGVLAGMTDDVDWPNAWEGGRLHGQEAVRDYWTRQWTAIDPHVVPVEIGPRVGGDGVRMEVQVRQLVRDLDGKVLAEGTVAHIYEMRSGLVARMEIEQVDG
jgi:ketosteroid isomerase-like protein